MNPGVTNVEKSIMDKVFPLQNKHIFTKNLGDGEINSITRKNDLSGIWVYFHSNLHGEIKLDGEEFLEEVEDTDRFCNKCDNKVEKSDLEEYSYQCLHCDEDLYEFETHGSQGNN